MSNGESSTSSAMFFDPTNPYVFAIDRLSGAGRMLRRVLILGTDGSFTLCKPSGIVTRIFHVSIVTHLIFAKVGEIRGATVLLRLRQQHDIFFEHVLDASTPQAATRRALELVQRLSTLHASTTGVAPLILVEHQDAALLKDAANCAKPSDWVQPRSFPFPQQVLVPLLYDAFPILVNTKNDQTNARVEVNDLLEIFVDASFVSMLQRAAESHPRIAFHPPLVDVDVPAPFHSIQLSSRFFHAFCAAYDVHLPLTVNLHSHLPLVTSFRCSTRFWGFMRRLLAVTRSSVMEDISRAHVEAYVVGAEKDPVLASVVEWNDAIVQWEIDVRQSKPSINPHSGEDVFWASFVDELTKIAPVVAGSTPNSRENANRNSQ